VLAACFGFSSFVKLQLEQNIKIKIYTFTHVMSPPLFSYCGVLTPCKSCNIETHSHDYATVCEAVFSLWQVAHRLTSLCLVCCQATAINTWMTQEWRRVTWTYQQWRHVFQRWHNNWSVSRVSDQGFAGETEARLRVSSRWETTVEGS
jgi:hypothetical protein